MINYGKFILFKTIFKFLSGRKECADLQNDDTELFRLVRKLEDISVYFVLCDQNLKLEKCWSYWVIYFLFTV